MPNRVTLRVCAAPLLPQHLVAALAEVDGMGFGRDETQSFGPEYHKTAMDALVEDIAMDANFAQAIRGRTFGAMNRAVSRFDARNQFMALAPALEICDFGPKPQAVLDSLLDAPFVVSFRTLGVLERARAGDADPDTSRSKLAGFVEHYLGHAAALFYERPKGMDFLKSLASA